MRKPLPPHDVGGLAPASGKPRFMSCGGREPVASLRCLAPRFLPAVPNSACCSEIRGWGEERRKEFSATCRGESIDAEKALTKRRLVVGCV